ncbi:MAG: ATP-grasp domain-containing protein, partial [Thiohalocapsa sp.]
MGAELVDPIAETRVRSIFNHDIMNCTADGVVGNHLYSGRALAATMPGDVIQLHPGLKTQWPAIREHYQRVGLRHTDAVVWDTGPQVLSDHPKHAVSVFFFGANEHTARPDAAWFRIVETINSKNAFMTAADRLKVPVPVTWPFAAVADIGETEIATAPYPCY